MVENQSLIVLYHFLTNLFQNHAEIPKKKANKEYQTMRDFFLAQEDILDLILPILINSETIKKFIKNLGFSNYYNTYDFKENFNSVLKKLEDYLITEFLEKNLNVEDIQDPLSNKIHFVNTMKIILKQEYGNVKFSNLYSKLRIELLQSNFK